MKLKFNSGEYLFISVLTVCTMLLISCNSNNVYEDVQHAYKIRLGGNADSAKVLLEGILSRDSTCAMAWYELSRTKHHIGLGTPRELAKGLDDIQSTINKAVEYDSSNVIYAFYKGIISYTRAYLSFMRGQPNAQEKVKEVIKDFKNVLNLKPDYYEASLYLIEILSVPKERGGDSLSAETYAKELESKDEVCGAKARELLLPMEVDRIEFWKKFADNNPDNAEVHEALGKAYIYKENIDEAKKEFESAMKLDSTKNYLYLDIGRYYMMLAMQNRVKLDSVAQFIESSFEKYLQSKPEPINPLKAFVLGKLAQLKFRTGDKEGGDKLQAEAMALDPKYSKAFAVPSKILFDPPDVISHDHEYFLRPF